MSSRFRLSQKIYAPLLFREGWSIILLKIVEKDYLKGENGVGLKVTFFIYIVYL